MVHWREGSRRGTSRVTNLQAWKLTLLNLNSSNLKSRSLSWVGLWFASKIHQIVANYIPRKLHLLRIEVADFLRHINNSSKGGVMTFLLPLLIRAAGSTDFDRQLFAAGLPDQLAPRLLLRVLRRARRLVDSLKFERNIFYNLRQKKSKFLQPNFLFWTN